MTKVFDVHGDVNVNTKDAERAINRMANSTRAFGDSMLQADRISVSLTRRLRSGFDTGMIASLKRDEGGFLALGNAIQVASAGLKKIENESVLTLRTFQRLQRVGFVTQSALGALAGSIGDLSGGFLSLIGIVGQAAYAFVGVGGALASVIAGFAVAKIAMSGVGRAVSQLWNGQNQYNRSLRDARKELKELKFDLEEAVLSEQEAAIALEKARTELAMAQDLPPDNMVRRESELAFQRADLNYRKAKARVNDLQDTIKRGGRSTAAAANADPFRNLTKSQIVFAKYLATLKPIMQALKEASASSFLPPLQTAIQTIVDSAFPTLEKGFKTIGSAMGDASKSFSLAFADTDNLRLIDQFFNDSAPRLRNMGQAADRFFTGLLNTLAAAKPLTDQFSTWILSVSSRFDVLSRSKSFKRTLDLAAYVSSQLGHVFGSFGDGIKNIMDANFPPGGGGAGQVLLDWLGGIASGFKKFTGSETFATWLKTTTTNATVMLGVIGDFLNIFIELSGRPEIQEFWTTLGKSIPDITKVLMDGLKAAPAFAALIVSVIDLFSAFSDTESISIFFDTLRSITDVFAAIFNNPVIKAILDFIGRINAVVLAVTLAISTMVLVGVGIGAILGQVAKNFGKLLSVGMGTVKWMTRFNLELAVAKPGIIGWGQALYKSIFGAISPTGKLGSTMAVLREEFRKNKIVFKEWLEGLGLLREAPSRFSKFINAVKVGFSALKATVMDAGLYIRTSLTDAMKKFRDVAGPALSNAKFAIYTTLIQKGRVISDFYNTRVIPVMNKFRDIVVNKFNDARLAIYSTLLQKGRMVADLYNTRVVPAFRNFIASISPQAIQMKMRFFAMGILMHIDLLDKRIIPAFMRIRDGIKNAVTQITTALSPENISARMIVLANSIKTGVSRIITALSPESIRLKTLGFRMGLMMNIDLIDKRIVPAFIRVSSAIKNGVTQIGVALSPDNIKYKMWTIGESIRRGVANIGAALSPQSIMLKTLGFRMGIVMQLDLIDKRIAPILVGLRQKIKIAMSDIRLAILNFGDRLKARFERPLWLATERLKFFTKMVRFNIAVLGRMNEIVVAVVRDSFRRFIDSVKQSTAMIKLHTAATKLAAAASRMWSGLTSKLSDVFKSTKTSLGGFIDRLKQKTATVQASTAAEIADTNAIKNKTKALAEQQAAAAAAAGARRPGGGMALMGAGFAAQGLISGAANGGMTAGSTLTTLGGAMMFIPGGMIAGLVVGIIGAIVQGFEAAESARKQEKADLVIQTAEITAERVNLASERSSGEIATLLASTLYPDIASAGAEVIRRQRVAAGEANRILDTTGLTGGTEEEIAKRTAVLDTIEVARKAFIESGIKITEQQMPALIRAATNYALTDPSATGELIGNTILSTFTKKGAGGGLPGVESRFADTGIVFENKVLTPGGQPMLTQGIRGVSDIAGEKTRIQDYILDPKNQVVRYFDNVLTGSKEMFGKPEIDTSGLAKLGISNSAFLEWWNDPKTKKLIAKNFDASAAEMLDDVGLGKYTKAKVVGREYSAGFQFSGDLFSPDGVMGNVSTVRGGLGAKPTVPAVTSPAPFSLGNLQGLYGNRMNSSIFSSSDINALRGTDDKPLITSIKPADIAALKADPNVTSRTVSALEKLSGVVDSAGGYLQIKDVSATDQIAPFIMYPRNASKSDKALIDDINTQLSQSFVRG